MFLLVVVQVGGRREGVSAGLAFVRLFTGVDSFMDFQVGLLRKVFTTVGTFELLRYLVILTDVTLQVSSAGELHATERALSDAAGLAVFVPLVFVESCLPAAGETANITSEILAAVTLLSVLPQTGLPVAFKITLAALVLHCLVKSVLMTFQ